MKIKKAEKSDLKEIMTIARSLSKWFTARGRRGIRNAFKSQRCFVASDKGKIVGFVMYRTWKYMAEIMWMGILPNYRRKGIGKTLLMTVQKRKRENFIIKRDSKI